MFSVLDSYFYFLQSLDVVDELLRRSAGGKQPAELAQNFRGPLKNLMTPPQPEPEPLRPANEQTCTAVINKTTEVT